MKSAIRAAALVALTLVIVFLGLRHYHTALCDGYELLRMNAYEAVIADPHNHIVTRGTVAMFAVKSPYVTGYTSSEHMSPDTDPVDGYFLIDTVRGTVADGLTEPEWKQKLSELHWEHPRMRKPW